MSTSAAKGTMGHAAISLDRLPAEILLEISSKLDSKDVNSLTRASGYFQYSEILQTTMFRKDVDNGEGRNDALHHACIHGDEALLQKALQNGAKINGGIPSDLQIPYVDILTQTGYVRPLFLAIITRQFAFATTLVTKHNADPNLAQCALPVPWPAERNLGELPLRFAIDILLAVVAGRSVQPYYLPVTLTKEQYDDADGLFSVLLERSELSGVGPAYDEQLYTRSAFLELAAWPRVPASWFARLLEHSEDPMALMLTQTVDAGFMPWEVLVTAGDVVRGPDWLSYKDTSPLVLDATYGENSRCASHTFKDSILGKLRAIVKYCDIMRLRNRSSGEWMMQYMTFLAVQRDTAFVLEAFDILLSAPSVDVNHQGERSEGDMTMLESLSEQLVWLRKYTDGTRFDAICRNVAGIMKQLLQRGADPCKAIYLNSEELGGGGESLILRIAECSHSSFSEVLETIIQLHKAATRQINTAVAAHHESRRETDLDLAQAQRQLAMCDVNLVNEHGENALHMACSSPIASLEIIDCLLRHGVDPVAKNRDGQTPLHRLCGNADLRGQHGLHLAKALMGKLTLRQQAEILKSRSKHSNQSPIELAEVKKQVLMSRHLKGLGAAVFGGR